MRALLLAALLLATLVPHATAAPVPMLLVSPEHGDASTTFTFTLDRPLEELGADVLRNGDFALGTSWWSYQTELAGRTAARVVEEGGSRLVALDAIAASKDGSVLVKQTRPLPGAGAYALSFDARQTGEPVRYAIILREEGYDLARHNVTRATWDTTFQGNLTEGWSTFRHTWTPRYEDSTHVTAMLRFLAKKGQTATVMFDNASLVPLGTLRWDAADGRAAVDGQQARVTFPTPGARTVSVDYVGVDGQRLRLSRAVEVDNDAHAVRIETDGPAAVGAPTRLRAHVDDPDPIAAIPKGTFTTTLGGWRSVADAATNATIAVEDGVLAMRVPGGGAGAAYAYAPFGGDLSAPALLRVTYRDEGDVQQSWIVRERLGNETMDTTFALPPSPVWDAMELPWEPQLPGADRVSLLLRVTTKGGAGAAFFDDVSVVRMPRVAWDLDGDGKPDARGLETTWVPQRAGVQRISLVATDGAGLTVPAALDVDVAPGRVEIDAPRALVEGDAFEASARLVGADARLRWYVDGADTGLEGARVSLPLAAGARVVEARAADAAHAGAAGRVVVAVVGAPELEPLGERARLRWAPLAGMDARYAWRSAVLDEEVALAVDAQNGTAELPLAVAAEGGVLEVSLPEGARVQVEVAPLTSQEIDRALAQGQGARPVPAGWGALLLAVAGAAVLARRR